MLAQNVAKTALAFILLLVLASPSHAADHKLGLSVQLESEGFFLNPVVKKLFVEDVTKGSLADAAGVKAGDEIIKIEGQVVAGKPRCRFRS